MSSFLVVYPGELIGHDVRTVQQEGWAGVTNGELLARAAGNGFEVFLTADQNLRFQQKIAKCAIGCCCGSGEEQQI